MNEQLKTNIQSLAGKSAAADKPDDAMKFAQAAVNLSQAIAILKDAGELKAGA